MGWFAGQGVLASKGLWDLFHGGDAGTKFVKEQVTQKQLEVTEEAELLNNMRLDPEKVRSLSPDSCKKAKEVGARLLLKHSLKAPAETTLRIQELHDNTVAQCRWCPEPKEPK